MYDQCVHRQLSLGPRFVAPFVLRTETERNCFSRSGLSVSRTIVGYVLFESIEAVEQPIFGWEQRFEFSNACFLYA